VGSRASILRRQVIVILAAALACAAALANLRVFEQQ
jgi:hypothetical protein